MISINRNIQAFLAILLAALLSGNSFAQISKGGQPLKTSSPRVDIEWVNLEDVRVEELLLEDEWMALTGKKNQRIAKEIPVSIRPDQLGNWSQSTNGTRIWQLGIRGEGAKALGIVFNRYELEHGCRIFISDPSGNYVLGAFTSRNNKPSGNLSVSYLQGDELIIQMEVPPGTDNYGELKIGSVRWAYLPVFEEKSGMDTFFGNSGPCNVDINCPLGSDWQMVKNSVVRMINAEKCTGMLINNVKEDDRAYIYTAAHCVFQNNKYQSTIFYFNYESDSCEGADVSVMHSISGATLISTGDTLENPRDGDSLDFALLELSIAPPDSFLPYFAGWNRSPVPAQKTTSIHHPSGDVKKISADYDPPEISMHDLDYFKTEGLIPLSFWRVLEWDVATTEPGSSGCPLFNQDQLFIGTLTGGQATCSFQENDYFTRFDMAWDYYPEPSKQLKHWLDPDNTGVMSLGGKAGDPLAVYTLPETGEFNVYPNPANEVLYFEGRRQNGSPVEIRIYNVTGNLVMQKRLSGHSATSLDVSGLKPGIYIFRITQGDYADSKRFLITR